MIKGLDLFKEHFKDYKYNYVLIGGTACWLYLEEAGIIPRTTNDLDLIILADRLTDSFAKHFREFIDSGGYEPWTNKEGKTYLYKYEKPTNNRYPSVIELLSKRSDILESTKFSSITPMMVDKNKVSISAIILDSVYYEFVMNHRVQKFDISIVDELCLIPLKAKAWLNLTADKAAGKHVDDRDINKHRSDVFRMSQLIKKVPLGMVSSVIKNDMESFLKDVPLDGIKLKNWKIYGTTIEEIIDLLKLVYCSD